VLVRHGVSLHHECNQVEHDANSDEAIKPSGVGRHEAPLAERWFLFRAKQPIQQQWLSAATM
jgi:hypothetical protein